ncbi:hypothetical protein GGR54DRAFT_477359 [Hypoxylon sp. NC1633]|nr:hypothetical protein GGR54DRAFT_477359 [Hypoxylon sp. NC1633]
MANPISMSSVPIKRGELDTVTRTAPEKSIILPLTPPASSERRPSGFDLGAVVKTFDDYRTGRNQQCAFIKLRPQDYYQLTEVLEHHPVLGPYTQDKLRFDYDPKPGLLYIRMTTPIHDFFATSIANDIHGRLQALGKSPDETGQFANRIRSGGSSRLFLREDEVEVEPVPSSTTVPSSITLKRGPDAQFQHQEAVYPGVVLEVSYSQDGKNLKKLARDYIQYSNGDIKVVIGIDINYGSISSTVSIWRPKFVREEGEELDILDVEQEVISEPFRSPTGEPLNETQSIRLTLSDFATDKLCTGLNSRAVNIPYRRLAELLGEAENMQKKREHGPGEGIKSDRKTKRRRIPSSSPESLRSEDENQFCLEESG